MCRNGRILPLRISEQDRRPADRVEAALRVAFPGPLEDSGQLAG
jgi:hypothetical protein